MFWKKPNTDPTDLDKAIEGCYLRMASLDEDTKEYAKVVKRLSELEELKNKPKKGKFKPPTSDAVLTAGASLLGILLILNYERTEVVTTKALGFVNKPKP